MAPRHARADRVFNPQAGPMRPAGERCRGRYWLLLNDACGLVCTVITYMLGFGSLILTDISILIPRIVMHGGLFGGVDDGILGPIRLTSLTHLLAYNFTIVMMIVSHLRCMLSNPGTAYNTLEPDFVDMMRKEFHIQKSVPPDAPANARSAYDIMVLRTGRRWWCGKCDTFRPRHTHHCSTCKSCVLEMDHHCPWVNNCIGWRNHKYFVLFVGYAWLSCIWTLTIMVRALFFPPQNRRTRRGHRLKNPLPDWPIIPDEDAIYDNVGLQLLCVIDAVVCFLLSIFACVMACDQWEYMGEGLGIVDKKQRKAKAQENATRGTSVDSDGKPLAGADEKLDQKPHSIAVDDAAEASSTSCCSCCGCCASCGCDNLPHIMGEPFGHRWFLPTAPPNHQVPLVVEDDITKAARARLSRANDGEQGVDADNICDQTGTQLMHENDLRYNGAHHRERLPAPVVDASPFPDGPRQRAVPRHTDHFESGPRDHRAAQHSSKIRPDYTSPESYRQTVERPLAEILGVMPSTRETTEVHRSLPPSPTVAEWHEMRRRADINPDYSESSSGSSGSE